MSDKMIKCGICSQPFEWPGPCKCKARSELAAPDGSLSGMSVKKILNELVRLAGEWRESEEQWRRNMDDTDGYDAVRMNCCRVRAKTLEDVIEMVKAEQAATSERQPTGNESSSAAP